jgi:PAS domain S-box-containing protein
MQGTHSVRGNPEGQTKTGHAHIATRDSDEASVLMLDEHGMICDCNSSCEALFGYDRGELLGEHVSLLLPQLDARELMRDGQPNPRLRFLCRVSHSFQAVSSDAEKFPCDLFLNVINWEGRDCLSLIVHPVLKSKSPVLMGTAD